MARVTDADVLKAIAELEQSVNQYLKLVNRRLDRVVKRRERESLAIVGKAITDQAAAYKRMIDSGVTYVPRGTKIMVPK